MNIIKKTSCIIVEDGSAIIGSFAGPDAERHAEIFVAALTPQPSQDERVTPGMIATLQESLDALIGVAKRTAEISSKYGLDEPAQPVALSTLTDEQLAFAAEQGYYDYWTEDSKGIQTNAWVTSAKAVLALAASAPAQQADPDMRAICEALGFDPTNHHNAAKCPYCRPAATPQPVAAEWVTDAQRLDWLARNLFEYKWNGVIDSGSRTNWFVRGDYRHTMQKMNGTTLREAIDAAMAGTGSDESKKGEA